MNQTKGTVLFSYLQNIFKHLISDYPRISTKLDLGKSFIIRKGLHFFPKTLFYSWFRRKFLKGFSLFETLNEIYFLLEVKVLMLYIMYIKKEFRISIKLDVSVRSSTIPFSIIEYVSRKM